MSLVLTVAFVDLSASLLSALLVVHSFFLSSRYFMTLFHFVLSYFLMLVFCVSERALYVVLPSLVTLRLMETVQVPASVSVQTRTYTFRFLVPFLFVLSSYDFAFSHLLAAETGVLGIVRNIEKTVNSTAKDTKSFLIISLS